jgi:uncharacterized membrane protein YkoI
MNVKRNTLIAGAAAAILAVGGVGVANAVSDDDGGATGPGADQAKAAALRLIPGGHVNAIERDGEKGATWEVEVRKPDGSTVDVRLDANYEAVAIDRDSEGN